MDYVVAEKRPAGSGPELAGSELRPLDQRAELHPHDLPVDLEPAGKRPEPAVDTGDHAPRPTPDAYLPMRSATSSGCSTKFDVESMTPGMMVLPAGSFASFQIFHSCSWRGFAPGKERAAGRPLQHDVHDVLQGDVRVMRRHRAAPADVHPHAVRGEAGRGLVEHLHVPLDEPAELPEGQVGEDGVPAQREIGTVELQEEARVNDRASYWAFMTEPSARR